MLYVPEGMAPYVAQHVTSGLKFGPISSSCACAAACGKVQYGALVSGALLKDATQYVAKWDPGCRSCKGLANKTLCIVTKMVPMRHSWGSHSIDGA